MIRSGLIALLVLLFPVAALAQDKNAAPLPADFEGQIAYFGNYTGKTTVLAERNMRYQPENCPYRDHRCYEQTVGGGVKVVLTFDGDQVTGFYFTVDGFAGPNGLASGRLVGRRTADGCELFQSDGTVWRGACNKREFRGDIGSVAGIPKQSDLSYAAVAMFVHDIGAIEAAKARIETYKARVRWLDGILSDPTAPPNSLVGATVEADSYSLYPEGVAMESISFSQNGNWWRKLSGKDTILGSFTDPLGERGTVRVEVRKRRVFCIAWNGGECLPPRPAPPPPLAPPEAPDDKGWFSFSGAPVVPGTRN